jgi:hypothetical protein
MAKRKPMMVMADPAFADFVEDVRRQHPQFALSRAAAIRLLCREGARHIGWYAPSSRSIAKQLKMKDEI